MYKEIDRDLKYIIANTTISTAVSLAATIGADTNLINEETRKQIIIATPAAISFLELLTETAISYVKRDFVEYKNNLLIAVASYIPSFILSASAAELYRKTPEIIQNFM